MKSKSNEDKTVGSVAENIIQVGQTFPYRSVTANPMQLLHIFINPFDNHDNLLLCLRSARILYDLLSNYSSPMLATNLFIKTLWQESCNFSKEELNEAVINIDKIIMVYFSVAVRPDWLKLGIKFCNNIMKNKKKMLKENEVDNWITKNSPKVTVSTSPFFSRLKMTFLKQSAEEKSIPTNFIRPMAAFLCECNMTHCMESKSIGKGTVGGSYYSEILLILQSYSHNNNGAFIFLMKQLFIYNTKHFSYFFSFVHAALSYGLPFFEHMVSTYNSIFQSTDFSELIECIIPSLPILAPYAALRGDEFNHMYNFLLMCKNNYHRYNLSWDAFLQNICLNALQVECNRNTANFIVRELLPQCLHQTPRVASLVWLCSLYLGSNIQLAKMV